MVERRALKRPHPRRRIERITATRCLVFVPSYRYRKLPVLVRKYSLQRRKIVVRQRAKHRRRAAQIRLPYPRITSIVVERKRFTRRSKTTFMRRQLIAKQFPMRGNHF